MACLQIGLLGTGSASHPLRNQSSVMIDYGEGVTIIDVGCGSWKTLLMLGYEIKDINNILITHAHIDHVCSLAHISFLAGFKAREKKFKVYTPGGLHRSIVENLLKAGSGISGSTFSISEVNENELINLGDAVIKPIRAIHMEGSLSYIIEFREPSVKIVVSGDTAPNRELAREARDADVVIHEATFPAGKGEEAIQAGHTSIDQVLALFLGAEELVLYHLSLESERSALSLRGKNESGEPGRVIIPSDGYVVKIC